MLPGGIPPVLPVHLTKIRDHKCLRLLLHSLRLPFSSQFSYCFHLNPLLNFLSAANERTVVA
ncbi:hypothetical protein Syun_012454 [Stephania yunnanensis]|uniref:Uncharacterized protein n=1 Tax=Stephania yunnanensis TaxID=152371 RepID=A0AAP0K094_9MAGN